MSLNISDIRHRIEAVDVEWMLKELEVLYNFYPEMWEDMRELKKNHLVGLLEAKETNII